MLVGTGIQGIDRKRDELLRLNPDAVLVMPGDIAEVRALRNLGWTGEVFLRPYDPDRMGVSGEQRAREDVDWLRIYNDVGIKHIIPDNELNLDEQHGDVPYPGYWDSEEAARQIDIWKCAYYDKLRGLMGDDKYALHWGALSPTGHERYDLMWHSLRRVDVHDIHVYSTGAISELDRIIAAIQNEAAGKPKFVTEVNRVHYVQFLNDAKKRGVEGAFWFLWKGNPEWAEYDLVDVPYREELRQYIIANKKEEPMPTDSVRAWLSDMWTRAGVPPAKQEGDKVFDWAVRWAKNFGEAFVPQPTLDGNYQNWTESDRWVLCYMYPKPVHFEKNVWEPKPGFPPQ